MIEVRISDTDAEAIAKHPDVYPCISDDMSPPREQYQKRGRAHGWINAVAYVDGKPAAYMALEPSSAVMTWGHFAIVPEYRHLKQDIGDTLINWARENTNFAKFHGWASHPAVVAYLESLGFRVEGISEGSLLRGGKLLPQALMGMRICRTQS